MSPLRLKTPFNRKWRNPLPSARSQREKEIGNKATNSVSKFPRGVEKCATRKMVQGSRAVAQRDSAERARTHFQRSHAKRNVIKAKFVWATRRNQHAGRVCSPEKCASNSEHD